MWTCNISYKFANFTLMNVEHKFHQTPAVKEINVKIQRHKNHKHFFNGRFLICGLHEQSQHFFSNCFLIFCKTRACRLHKLAQHLLCKFLNNTFAEQKPVSYTNELII